MATELEKNYRRDTEARTVDYYNTGVLSPFAGVPVYHREGRWYVSKRDLKQVNLAEARDAKGFPIWDITDVETGESARRFPRRTWEHIEDDVVPGDPDEWRRTCYFCGKVCESEEAMENHEADHSSKVM